MKTLLFSAAALGLLATVASAQVAAPPPPPAPSADSAAPPPPPPMGGEAPGPHGPGGPGPRGDRRDPPPPPSKAAHFRLESAGVVLDVKCAEDAPMQACADIALQMLDRAIAPGTAAPRP